ncbi:hypothetical protein [Vulgatibacter incomptus]|uniref:Uncharacterized protein n=1 Tax=Vulgatibacter incomptus TaxID=1391653 RepID=A0A0K1PCY8_9BACT|nr:hypothetical protein [Vulgatibacter incomptus]AKU91367.1 hypothetical protein AKJ08_1754 [Vulgatibacter incomptus]
MAASTNDVRYLEAVQELFLSLRGSGLTLAPIDADRIRGWRDRGLPLELALGAVRSAHAAWASSGRSFTARPFRLGAVDRYAEDLLRGWERRAAGAAAGNGISSPSGSGAGPRPAKEARPPLQRAVAALEYRLALAPGPVREAYLESLRILQAANAADAASVDRALLAADEASALRYLRALPPRERAVLAGGARREAGPRGAATRRQYRAMLRACLGDAARRHGALVRPSDL